VAVHQKHGLEARDARKLKTAVACWNRKSKIPAPFVVNSPFVDPFDFEPALHAATTMNAFARPWCLCGGWAIDLWLGQSTRQHEDVDVALLREDQLALKFFLEDWKFWLLDGGVKKAWRDWQMRMLPIHEIHGTSPQGRQIEFLLNESQEDQWVYRRAFGVRRPLETWIVRAAFGVPVLAPEIVLLYKSKDPTPADELDFRVAVDRLEPARLGWLDSALRGVDPNHPWLGAILQAAG